MWNLNFFSSYSTLVDAVLVSGEWFIVTPSQPRAERDDQHLRKSCPVCRSALGACKSETDTSKVTFRIGLFARSMVVPGRVVIDLASQSTGEKSIQRPVKLLGRMNTKSTTRKIM